MAEQPVGRVRIPLKRPTDVRPWHIQGRPELPVNPPNAAMAELARDAAEQAGGVLGEYLGHGVDDDGDLYYEWAVAKRPLATGGPIVSDRGPIIVGENGPHEWIATADGRVLPL